MSIPWAFVSPGRSYFKLLRIIKVCPEIAHLIHEKEGLRLKRTGLLILTAPYALLLVALALIAMSLQWIVDRLDDIRWWNPYVTFNRQIQNKVDEAHAILAPREIRKRLELA